MPCDVETFDSEARLAYVLAVLAGVLGATAFTHSAGYFVTFMTGNAQRAVLGYFRDDVVLSVTAGLLLLSFVAGVVVASVCRRHFWVAHPHGPTVLTTFSLLAATCVDVFDEGWDGKSARLPADHVAGLRNWRAEHLIRQRRRGVGATELCDRNAGQDGSGHRTSYRRRRAVATGSAISCCSAASSSAPPSAVPSACSSTAPGCWFSPRRCARWRPATPISIRIGGPC